MEVRSLLSQAMLDMPGHVSGNLTPKRPNPMVILTPPPHKLRDLSGLVDTSSQVSAPDDAGMAEASLEEVPTTISPIAETPGPSSGTNPPDTSHLWEKANKALAEMLDTKWSINAHRKKVVWELGMEPCWNNSKTTESIKEARAICTHATQDTEALCSATVKEAKATCAHTIWEAKAQGASQLTHSNRDISRPSNTWRNKSSKRKVRVRLTSSLPVKLPYKPAL